MSVAYPSSPIWPAHVIPTLDSFCGIAGKKLQDFTDRSLGEYLTNLPSKNLVLSDLALRSRKHIATATHKAWGTATLVNSGSIGADAAIESLWRSSVLFTGPHLQLLPERFTFAGYLTALAFAMVHEECAAWLAPCATLRLQVERKRGPGWLAFNDQSHNIFGLSVQQLKRRRVCSNTAELEFTFGSNQANTLHALSNATNGVYGKCPADLFHLANRNFLEANTAKSDPSLVMHDERFTAMVIAEHLEDGTTPVADLLLNPNTANRYKEIMEDESGTADSRVFRHPTEHFWLSTSMGHLAAIFRDSEGWFCKASDGTRVIEAKANVLADALREGTLVPSLFLSYFALGFLPRIRLIGGVRQMFYHKHYFVLWQKLLDKTKPSNREFLETLPTESDDHWALNALEANPEMSDNLITAGGLSLGDYARRALDRPLSETTHGFDAIVEHEYFPKPPTM